MSTWRRRAIELFPDLRTDLRRSRTGYTIYSLLSDLRYRAEQAHAAGDSLRLQRIYGFVEWCSRQPAEDLWNAAGVCFYEHLLEDAGAAHRVIPYLSRFVIEKHWDLWSVSCEERWPDIERVLRTRLGELPDEPASGASWEWGG